MIKIRCVLLLIVVGHMLINPALATPVAIAVHGGAGTLTRENMSPQQEAAYREKLREAVSAGHALLLNGSSAVDAVTEAVRILEDSPLFNAGRGAVYTFDGQHELDAAIMRGEDRAAGAVAGVRMIKNPILLARLVMEKSAHVMLSGEGAQQFAWEQGMQRVAPEYFDDTYRYQQLLDAKQKMGLQTALQATNQYKFGTVGAVARDRQGNLAAATSTGGMTAKRYGRIGDSPVIGAGTFADNLSCAVSATGHGEFFIRFNVAADICARVRYQGVEASSAANQVVHQVLKDAGGSGGVIVMDKAGQITMPFNTLGMYRAAIDVEGKMQVAIFKKN